MKTKHELIQERDLVIEEWSAAAFLAINSNNARETAKAFKEFERLRAIEDYLFEQIIKYKEVK